MRLPRWKDISIPAKLYLVVGTMATLLICELGTLRFAMHTLSAARSLVGGEGLWSKAQKSAVIDLMRYGQTRDEADYSAFLADFEIPDGDHQARLALLRVPADRVAARQGFLRGHIEGADIGEVIDLLQRFGWTSYLSQAIDIWSRGDQQLAALEQVGLAYRSAVLADDREAQRARLLELKKLNEELTALQTLFSAVLGAGSRWLEYLVLSLLSIAVLLVEGVGLTLAFVTSRAISRGLLSLNRTAIEIGNGHFVETPLLDSNDELGQLARSLRKMGETLQRSHAELETRVEERTLELGRSRDQLDVILEGISDGITVIDDQGKFLYVNDAGAKQCGFGSREEFLRTPQAQFPTFLEMLDEDGQPFPMEKLPSRLAFSGVESPPEAIVRSRHRSGGEERWAIVKSSPVFDEHRKAKLVVTIFKDVTERKREEEALKLLDESSQALASSMDYEETLHLVARLAVPRLADWCLVELLDDHDVPQPIALAHVDPQKIVFANELREKFPPDTTGTTGSARVIRSGIAQMVNDITDAQLATSARDAEHLAGLRSLGINAAIIVPVIAQGKPFGAITWVSAESKRRYTNADLRMAKELARRAGIAIENARHYQIARKAVALRDEFLSIASHELKTPLTSLSLQLQMAKRKLALHAEDSGELREALAKSLEVSGRQARRLAELIDDLMDVSRIQSGKLMFTFGPVNLSAVLREVSARHVDLLARVGSTLWLEIPDGIEGSFDQTRIEQLVDNLLSNAAKYAPGQPIRLSLERSGRTVKVVVADHGPGISAELQPRIFERFERATTSGETSGLGLGLFIAREVATGHGGSIQVESEPGQGTRFIIELPLSGEADSSGSNGAPRPVV